MLETTHIHIFIYIYPPPRFARERVRLSCIGLDFLVLQIGSFPGTAEWFQCFCRLVILLVLQNGFSVSLGWAKASPRFLCTIATAIVILLGPFQL